MSKCPPSKTMPTIAATCCCQHQGLCGLISSRGITGRCTCCEMLVPPILGFNSTGSNLLQLLFLIHLHITTNSSCTAVPYTKEGSSGMPQLMICLFQTNLLQPILTILLQPYHTTQCSVLLSGHPRAQNYYITLLTVSLLNHCQ